jgi:sulfopyruvate decarboxylase subunit beta
MNRMDALQEIVDKTVDLPVVATCAATSRELAYLADRDNHLYLLDAMGLTASVATGLSIALDGERVRKVVAIDGDGSLLMNMGALATAGFLCPSALLLIVLDNGSYASTADIPTYTHQIDLGAISESCGLSVLRANDPQELADALAMAISTTGPHVVHVRIEPGNSPNIPLLLMDPVLLAGRFEQWIATEKEKRGRPEAV